MMSEQSTVETTEQRVLRRETDPKILLRSRKVIKRKKQTKRK